MKIVLYNMDEPDIRVTVCEAQTQREADRIMKLLMGKGWNVDRRPNLHTFDRLALTSTR
jgi:hypothetical protein